MLITEIAAAPSLPSSFVSLHLSPCMLITEIAAAPSLPSSFVSLHLSPCMLITEIAAAPSLPSSFVSLHLSPCMLITEIAAAPSLPSSFVSLHLSPCMKHLSARTWAPSIASLLSCIGASRCAAGARLPGTLALLGASLWHSSGAADSGAAELPVHPELPDLNSTARDNLGLSPADPGSQIPGGLA